MITNRYNLIRNDKELIEKIECIVLEIAINHWWLFEARVSNRLLTTRNRAMKWKTHLFSQVVVMIQPVAMEDGGMRLSTVAPFPCEVERVTSRGLLYFG